MVSLELDNLRTQLDGLRDLSHQLMSITGHQHNTELEKIIKELTQQWQTLNDQCTARLQLVDSAVQQATSFNDKLQVRL